MPRATRFACLHCVRSNYIPKKMAVHPNSVKIRMQTSLNDIGSLTKQLMEVVNGDIKPNDPHQSLMMSSVLDKLLERDKEIQSLTETALEMCGRQRQLGMVGEELERRGQEIRDLQARLQDAEKILELAVFHGKQKLESIEQAKKGAVSPETLIRYAHRISQACATVSPVGWQPSDPRRPFPQDIEMRSGLLGQLTSSSQFPHAGTTEGYLPPEKKMAMDPFPTRIMAGMNQNNNKPPLDRQPNGSGGGLSVYRPIGAAAAHTASNIMARFEDPEVMSEDSSPSSSED